MKKLLMAVLFLSLAFPSYAVEVYTFGWEDGISTDLGQYGTGTPPIIATNVMAPDPVYSGSHSLRLEDNSPSGTPQSYLAWVQGLSEGDVVTAGFWRYDDSPGASPSVRIWGKWCDADNIDDYHGSAGGNGDYGEGLGWDLHTHSWTVPAGHSGIVIHARTYSSAGDTTWLDDLFVELPDGSAAAGVKLYFPGTDYPVATEGATMSQIKALY